MPKLMENKPKSKTLNTKVVPNLIHGLSKSQENKQQLLLLSCKKCKN